MVDAILAVIEDKSQRSELAEFYKINKRRFFAVAFSKLHNKTDAEDAVQEAFLRITDKPEKFFEIPPHKRVAYTDVIIRNISCDTFKDKLREPITSITETEEICDDYCFEDILIGKENFDALVDFIYALPEGQKSALMLRITHKLSTADIARALNISETAARKRLSDAGKSIKKFLKGR